MTTPYANADAYVGEQIHLELYRRRLTRRELARRLGISEQSLGRKVNGVSTFTLDELLLVSRFLERPVADLLPGADYDPRPGRGRRAATTGPDPGSSSSSAPAPPREPASSFASTGSSAA